MCYILQKCVHNFFIYFWFDSNIKFKNKTHISFFLLFHKSQIIKVDIGLYRIILDSNIQKIDVIAHKNTPPHPRSRLHAVVNIRLLRTYLAARAVPPIFVITIPSIKHCSIGSSKSLSDDVLTCCRLKWIIIRVNNAKRAGEKYFKWLYVYGEK